MNDTALKVVLVIGGLGTLALRASFLVLLPGDRLPAWARRGLGYVAPAVLAALAVPAFLPSTWPVEDPGALARPAAGLMALLVAWRFGNVLLTIAAGMSTLWILKWILNLAL